MIRKGSPLGRMEPGPNQHALIESTFYSFVECSQRVSCWKWPMRGDGRATGARRHEGNIPQVIQAYMILSDDYDAFQHFRSVGHPAIAVSRAAESPPSPGGCSVRRTARKPPFPEAVLSAGRSAHCGCREQTWPRRLPSDNF